MPTIKKKRAIAFDEKAGRYAGVVCCLKEVFDGFFDPGAREGPYAWNPAGTRCGVLSGGGLQGGLIKGVGSTAVSNIISSPTTAARNDVFFEVAVIIRRKEKEQELVTT